MKMRRQMRQMTPRRYLALSVQLPGAFALCLCGAYLAMTSAQPILAACLLGVAAWCGLMWLILMRTR